MYLRALVMLGYASTPVVKDTPKSCVKANYMALLLCAECYKRSIDIDITDKLLRYFRAHHVFYKSTDLTTLMLDGRTGWRNIDTFFPFEPMRVGLPNLAEAFCALGCTQADWLQETKNMLASKKNEHGQIVLEGTLTKSYLPKERIGKPSKWATFYALLAERHS